MTELVFFSAVAVSSLIALGNWRVGIYLIIVLDVLRDPVRKIASGHSMLITLSATMVWGAALIGSMNTDNSLFRLLQNVPRLRKTIQLFTLAVLPGFIISILANADGYKVAAIGSLTYIGPVVGLIVGYTFARDPRAVIKVLTFYTVVNAIALLGTLLEYSEIENAVLGPLPGTEWIRHQPGYIVNLISGVYRSPDVMGLHAAFVATFSMILLVNRRDDTKYTWVLTAILATYCVILCGRRKMIGIPIAAFITIQFFAYKYRGAGSGKMMTGLFVVLGIILISAFVMPQGIIDSEYTDYATTTVTEARERLESGLINATLKTFRQSGILGAGLGSATQGRHYVSSTEWQHGTAGWQEDGISRMLVELGLPGVILMAVALGSLVTITLGLVRDSVPGSLAHSLQIALVGFVVANIASFMVSHQIYTGDPNAVLFVTFTLGIAWSCTRMNPGPADFSMIHDRQPYYG